MGMNVDVSPEVASFVGPSVVAQLTGSAATAPCGACLLPIAPGEHISVVLEHFADGVPRVLLAHTECEPSHIRNVRNRFTSTEATEQIIRRGAGRAIAFTASREDSPHAVLLYTLRTKLITLQSSQEPTDAVVVASLDAGMSLITNLDGPYETLSGWRLVVTPATVQLFTPESQRLLDVGLSPPTKQWQRSVRTEGKALLLTGQLPPLPLTFDDLVTTCRNGALVGGVVSVTWVGP